MKLSCSPSTLPRIHVPCNRPSLVTDKILEPSLLVLQEKDGEFGPRVRETLFNAPNLLVTASVSGKCTTAVLERWSTQIIEPNLTNKSILLLDVYGGFNRAFSQNNDIQICRIPKHTTGIIQPLDVYFFRPFKNFLKYLSDTVLLMDIDCILHVRNNVMRMISLVMNQFASPRFKPMIEYAWFKSGYTSEKPPGFVTPVQYCFKFDQDFRKCALCEGVCFLKCGWCQASLCFQHFFEEYHLCHNFVE